MTRSHVDPAGNLTDLIASTYRLTTASERAVSVIARFRAEFDEIRSSAVRRELDSTQPYAEIRRLVDGGFTKLTVPISYGGDGLNLQDFSGVLVELARADSNVAHALRSHFGAIESALVSGDPSDKWILHEAATGSVFGTSGNEKHSVDPGITARLSRADDGGLVLNGVKYFSTGAIFADWTSTIGVDEDGELQGFYVKTTAPGVNTLPDWGGFGQRASGSGSTVLTDVRVDAEERRSTRRHVYENQTIQFGFWQFVLLGVLVGIGQAALDDAVEFLTKRNHNFAHGLAQNPKEDHVVQAVVGEVASLLFAAEASLEKVTRIYDAAREHAIEGGEAREPERAQQLLTRLSAATFQGQAVIVESVLAATTKIFDIGGASAVERDLALDRHWRNARTVAQHNPHRFRLREVGSNILTGSTPDYGWGKPRATSLADDTV